jgi:hypothetical protein
LTRCTESGRKKPLLKKDWREEDDEQAQQHDEKRVVAEQP